MPKVKIVISIIVGLVMTADLLPAQATIHAARNNSSSIGISPTAVAGRGSRRRHRVPVQGSGGGRGGFGKAKAPSQSTPSIFPPANPPAAGGSKCTVGRGGRVCR
jgi:hypothetical protein